MFLRQITDDARTSHREADSMQRECARFTPIQAMMRRFGGVSDVPPAGVAPITAADAQSQTC